MKWVALAALLIAVFIALGWVISGMTYGMDGAGLMRALLSGIW